MNARARTLLLQLFSFLALILVIVPLSGCGGSGTAPASIVMPLIGPAGPQRVAPRAQWDFLVYLDGDNNLENNAIENFLQMEQIGSSNDVNILVLFDRIPGYDDSHGNWTNTRLYRITKNVSGDRSQFVSTYLKDFGEANMADPQTLTNFITYCHQWFPADHVALTLWDHGGGVYPRSLAASGSHGSLARGIAWDDTTGSGAWDCLTTDQVAAALQNARAQTGQKINISNLDACLMQLMEVAYQWRNETDYLVGSEETVPAAGNKYDAILNDLAVNPAIAPRDYALALVNDYYHYYQGQPGYDTTYSALDLGQIGNVFQRFSDFAAKLNAVPDNLLVYIKNARTATTSFDYPELVDLTDFLIRLQAQPGSGAGLVNAAAALQTALTNLIIANQGSGVYPLAHRTYGLGILFPASLSDWQYYSDSNRYPLLGLAQDTEWDSFIARYVNYAH